MFISIIEAYCYLKKHYISRKLNELSIQDSEGNQGVFDCYSALNVVFAILCKQTRSTSCDPLRKGEAFLCSIKL